MAIATLLLSGAAAAQSCEITVLGLAERGQLHEDYRDRMVEPGPYQQRLVERSKSYLTPLSCFAVNRVAFVEQPPEDAAATGWVLVYGDNDIVHLDARPLSLSDNALNPSSTSNSGSTGDVWAGGIDAIVHEATHAAVHLLNSQSSVEQCRVGPLACEPVRATQWSSGAQTAARVAVERARLEGGFVEEWVRMHEAFVQAGMATEYGAYEGSKHDATALTAAGFTSLYGSTKPGEDIAEWVAKTQVGDLQGRSFEGAVVGNPSEDLGCMVMRGAGERVTGSTAAAFAKVSFLRDVGLVSQEAFERCVGGMRIETFGKDGLHLTNDDGSVGTLDDRLRAVIGQAESGAWTFQFTSEGTARHGDTASPVKATLTIDLAAAGTFADTPIEEVSWPRGIYVIGQNAEFRVDFEDVPAATFVGVRGFVLVTRASNDALEGSIVLQLALRPNTLVPVPETGDWLPTPITFRLESGALRGP